MTWAVRLLAMLVLAVTCVTASAQQTGRRVALVIGNSAYAAQGQLANPGPDARLVADALRRVGFQVTQQTDLGKQRMDLALRDFSRTADGAEVALVYYAGHGLEANGVNWLLPVDATLAEERDLSFEAVNLDTVLATVERARGLRMVVLDACRNNPFARSMRRSAGTRATVTRGLADVEVTGTLVLFAARGGTVAQDGAPGANSPFAAAFARRIPEPGVDIRVLAGKVRDDVLAATGRVQEPFSYGSLPGVELALTAGAPSGPVDPRAVELAYWNSCCGGGGAASAAALNAYLSKVTAGEFPGTFAETARQRVASLAATPPQAPPPTPQAALTFYCRSRQAITRIDEGRLPDVKFTDMRLPPDFESYIDFTRVQISGTVDSYIKNDAGRWERTTFAAQRAGERVQYGATKAQIAENRVRLDQSSVFDLGARSGSSRAVFYTTLPGGPRAYVESTSQCEPSMSLPTSLNPSPEMVVFNRAIPTIR
jgi:hypothetical protein